VNVTRKELDRRRREADFLAAAEKLFAEKGYHRTSIEDIAREAKYGTGTIYRYFKTKEELYTVLMRRKGMEFLEFIKAQVAAARTPLERVRTLINGKIEFFVRHREFFLIYAVREGAVLSWTFRDRFHERLKGAYQEYEAFLRETLRSCMKAGGLRRMDAAKLAAVFSGMTNHLLCDALREGDARRMEEARQFLLDLVERGFTWPAGAGGRGRNGPAAAAPSA
jgi:AcrR family transcriptional regulator